MRCDFIIYYESINRVSSQIVIKLFARKVHNPGSLSRVPRQPLLNADIPGCKLRITFTALATLQQQVPRIIPDNLITEQFHVPATKASSPRKITFYFSFLFLSDAYLMFPLTCRYAGMPTAGKGKLVDLQ